MIKEISFILTILMSMAVSMFFYLVTELYKISKTRKDGEEFINALEKLGTDDVMYVEIKHTDKATFYAYRIKRGGDK